MSISQSAKETMLALLGAVSYYLIATIFLPLVTSVPMPDWLGNHFGKYSILAWLQLIHGSGLALISVPFALSIHFLQLRRPVLTAFGVAFLGLIIPIAAPHAAGLLDYPMHSQVSAALDFVKFLGTLPLLTWLVTRTAPSNNFKPKPVRGPTSFGH